MVNYHFLNTATQKAFINGVPGCSEHHLKLLSILQEARRRCKSLCICWLELANIYMSLFFVVFMAYFLVFLFFTSLQYW